MTTGPTRLSRLPSQNAQNLTSLADTTNDNLPRKDYRRIFEMGVSSAFHTLALAEAFPQAQISGCDVSRAMLEYARVQANERGLSWRLYLGRAEDTRLPGGSFDLVSSFILPHELPAEANVIGVKTAQLIGIASTSAATFFMLVEILKRSPADLPALGLPVLATSVIATPILAWLSRRIGKKGGYLIGALSTAAGALSWVWAQPTDPLYYLMLRGVVTGIAFSANVMFATSMLNDAMELDALRTGLRREGLYSALYSFVDKFGGAVGPAVVGAALLGVAYIPTGCAVIAVTLLFLYRLDQRALKTAREASLGQAGLTTLRGAP